MLKRDVLQYGVPGGIIDIHQDNEIEGCDFYSYIFDKRNIYRRIMAKLDFLARRCRNVKYFDYDECGRKFYDQVDREGFIFLHDGGITDLFYRLGSAYSVTSKQIQKCRLKRLLK